MTEKRKNKWQKLWDKTKTFFLGAAMAASPLASSAATGSTSPEQKSNTTKTASKTPNITQNTNTIENAFTYTDINAKNFRAYSGKYYNEICNGSLCWISSQSETNGCGEGAKKNISSAQIWSSNGLYAGINQMDKTQRKAYLNWMKDKKEYSLIYNILKNNNTKSGWAKAAKTNEHLFLISQENYMSSQYAPEKFKNLQTRLDELNLNIDIRTIHPAIIAEMHKMMVQSPGAYKKIANVTQEFLKTHKADSLNSAAYAKAIAPCVKISWKKLAPHTIEVMNDSSINWKEDQYLAAFSKVNPKNPAKESWFTKIQRETREKEMLTKIKEEQKQLFAESKLTNLNDATSIDKDSINMAITQNIKLQTISKRRLIQTEAKKARNLAQLKKEREKQNKFNITEEEKNNDENIAVADNTEVEIIAAENIAFEVTKGTKLSGRKAKQADRKLKRYQTDENYRKAVNAAFAEATKRKIKENS